MVESDLVNGMAKAVYVVLRFFSAQVTIYPHLCYSFRALDRHMLRLTMDVAAA